MKKIVKILITLILIYAIFIAVESLRLRYFYDRTFLKPLITISEEQNEDLTREKYSGLGYSITYYCNPTFYSSDNVQIKIYGAEFRLFGNILIWAWIT